ncbi:MAG TPA: hypothetical protein VFL91_21235 [Thermomicrobiales bacterium]|nr:hypothetical protein [Thermomicrobiales bacterium]
MNRYDRLAASLSTIDPAELGDDEIAAGLVELSDAVAWATGWSLPGLADAYGHAWDRLWDEHLRRRNAASRPVAVVTG